MSKLKLTFKSACDSSPRDFLSSLKTINKVSRINQSIPRKFIYFRSVYYEDSWISIRKLASAKSSCPSVKKKQR